VADPHLDTYGPVHPIHPGRPCTGRRRHADDDPLLGTPINPGTYDYRQAAWDAVLFVLALATGLRRGELLGLRWADVDLAGRVLFVRQTLQRTEAGLAFAPPKTHRSTRPLPLSGLAVRALERQRVRQAKERLAAGELWEDQGLAFGTRWSRGTSTGASSSYATPPAWAGCTFTTCGMPSPPSCSIRARSCEP
jgi:integrase